MSQPSDNPRSTSEAQATPNHALTSDPELAQAFKDLARGAQQAAALEAKLASLESKLDALLASVLNDEEEIGQGKDTDSTGKQNDPGKGI